MQNVKEGNGFVTQGELLTRMHKFRPPNGDYYLMRKIPDSVFSEVGVTSPLFSGAMSRLFKIYTGNEELFLYIRQLYHDTANALRETAKSEEWIPC